MITDDVIGYVHRILPDDVQQQIASNIVAYRAWYEAYRKALDDKIEFDETTDLK